MRDLSPVNSLSVMRTLVNGQKIKVGELAQNKLGIYFQYEQNYIEDYHNLSPFSLNQDDHTKNWSFMMNDRGVWSPSPFYDVTFSPNPYNEHMLAFEGYGKKPLC